MGGREGGEGRKEGNGGREEREEAREGREEAREGREAREGKGGASVKQNYPECQASDQIFDHDLEAEHYMPETKKANLKVSCKFKEERCKW